MNRVLLLLGLFVFASAHADTNVIVNGDRLGCTEGETRCGADGWTQRCTRMADGRLAWGPHDFRNCGSAVQCAAGDKKCGPDGKIMECRANPIGGATSWNSTSKGCQ